MAEQTVELAPGESRTIAFEAIPAEARTYQVSVNGLTGSFAAIAPVAEFAYVSDVSLEWIPDTYDKQWSVDVQNIGDATGECTVYVYDRMRAPRGTQWSSFNLRDSQTQLLEPGEVRTFSGVIEIGPYTKQVMVKSEAGTLLNPSEPKEYLCGCCFELTGQYSSFATQEELDAHWASAHPEYSPMPRLEIFTLRGPSWPDHFYHQSWVNPEREDYGRITVWRATCLLNERDFVNGEGNFSPEHQPMTGTQYVGTDEALQFIMPENWVGARRGPCGIIPNSTWLKLYFRTDLGWSGWLCWSGWLLRIPNGSEITFEVDSERCRNWSVT